MLNNREGCVIEHLESGNSIEIDERKRIYLLPKRIVWKTDDVNCAVYNSTSLLENKSKQISLYVARPCILENRNGNAAILLDFGQEIHGGLEFSVYRIEGAPNAKLRIRFGESVMEAMSDLGGRTHATNDHAIRDLTITVQELSMNPVGETGFRFVRIDLLSYNVRIEFYTVKAVMVYRDIPYLGSFCCSDPLLNRIWNVGAYTVHMNMQHYIWDGIKRDRLVWAGDLHPEIETIQTVFGNQKVIRDSLDFVVKQTRPGAWMNDIPSYSMWWVIIQHDYFMQFGDREYLEKQLSYIKNICKMLSLYIDENGLDCTPEDRFVDWPTKGNKDAVDLGLQALHVLATRCAIRIFEIFNDNVMLEQCRRDYQKLCSYHVHMVNAKQANALAVWAGIIDAKEANEKSLKIGGAEGLSTFMAYYILQARAQAGDVAGALDTIRMYWGGMLKLGATTFWEDFDIKWLKNAAPIDQFPNAGEVDVHGTYGKHCYKGYRHSLCHGWSSSVACWLTKYILGIEIMEPGCRKIRVQPELCGLQWVRGTYPTPEGVLAIECQLQEDGSVKTEIRAPEGVEVAYEKICCIKE